MLIQYQKLKKEITKLKVEIDCLKKTGVFDPDEWSLKVVSVSNGWKILIFDSEAKRINEMVFEKDSYDEDKAKEKFVELLWEITDYFSQAGSKHDKKRIQIQYKRQK